MLHFVVILYMTIYYLRPAEWVPGLIGTPLLMLVGIASLLLLGFGAVTKQFPNILSGNVERIMFGFTATIMVSHITNGYMGGAINSLNTFLPTATGFLLIISFLSSRQRITWFVYLLICLTAILASEGWLQHATGFANGGLEPIYQKVYGADGEITQLPRIRWYGVFNDPNDLGLALVLVVPFLLNMLMQRNFIIPLLTLPPILTAIYFTNSRGTVLAGLVGIASYFVIKYRSAKGFLVGGVLALILLTFGPSRMSSVSAGEESAYGRIEAWYEAYQMFKSNPLFGVGYGMFTEHHELTAHNSFVLVMAELGFAGLFLFIGMFYFAYFWLWQNIMKRKSIQFEHIDLGLISAAYASLTGILTSMFFLSRAYVLLPYMALAVVTGITRNIDSDTPDHNPPKHLRNIAIITVLQILCINILIKLTL